MDRTQCAHKYESSGIYHILIYMISFYYSEQDFVTFEKFINYIL